VKVAFGRVDFVAMGGIRDGLIDEEQQERGKKSLGVPMEEEGGRMDEERREEVGRRK
jgi:hypothetical protein